MTPTDTQKPILVYVAGPFRGDSAWDVEQNIRAAEEAALAICRFDLNDRLVGICPHSMYRFFEGALPDAFWLGATMELLRRCDAIFTLPRWGVSAGARAEVAEARRLGLPEFRYVSELVDVDFVTRGRRNAGAGNDTD